MRLRLPQASPGEARNGRNAAAIGLGVGAAVAGAAIASSAYNSGYYYGDPGYAYGPGYAYAPGYAYDDGYAYGAGLCAAIAHTTMAIRWSRSTPHQQFLG